MLLVLAALMGIVATVALVLLWTQRTRSTESAGLRSFPNVAALTAATGRGDFELVWLRGYYFEGDGGQGWLAFNPVSAPSADGGMVFAAAGEGCWVRYWDRVTMHADWWGCRHDGDGQGRATDDQPRLQAALNWSSDCYTVQLGRGVYALSAPLEIPVGKTLQGQAGGDGGMYQEHHGGASVLEYQGPSSDALTACAVALNSGCVLRRLSIHPAVGVHLTAGVGLSNPVNTSTPLCEDVGVDGVCGHWMAKGYFEHCLMIGAGSSVQDDNLEWNRGFMNNAVRSAVAWAGGQPYNAVFNHVRYDNFLGIGGSINNAFGYEGKAAAGSFGTVFEYRGEAQSFGSLTVNGGEVEYYATLLKGFSSITTYIQIRNVEWEGVRRLWMQGSYAKSWIPVTFLGGRYSTANTETTVYGQDGQTVEISPDDQSLICDRSGAAFSMLGVEIGAGGPSEREEGWKFDLDPHCTFNAVGCVFPNLDVVRRMNMNACPNTIGGTYIQGCRGFSSLVPEGNSAQYADRSGPENTDGFVTIRDAATSLLVTLPKPEWGRGTYDGGNYGAGDGTEPIVQIEAFATRASAGCSPSAFNARVLPHWSSVYYPVQEFDLVLDEAPGEGEFITYSYRLSLNRQFS